MQIEPLPQKEALLGNCLLEQQEKDNILAAQFNAFQTVLISVFQGRSFGCSIIPLTGRLALGPQCIPSLAKLLFEMQETT
jgi:hypothetical protein